ncbi:metal-dependent hydrolase [Halovenus rubra]|uniref:Metal-dependent hydrolase n=2 Tax=Halovenus rubra TaxID=869890 RepID=A0ACC7E151_9EURY|nr:metal-dependent hydrolase [Halovenus rubra]
MPSTIVHMAFAALIAAALLGRSFDRKSMVIVLGAVGIIDFDSFIPLVIGFGHRAIFHNLLIPVLGAVLVVADVYIREESVLLKRWGRWGVRVAWVAILCYAFAGVLLDMTDGVVNLLWPVHDQFYTLSGQIELSDQRGLVQTFIEWGGEDGAPAPEAVGSTEEVDITTGVDPGGPATPDEDPERIFPVIGATWELLVVVTGTFVTAARFQLDERPEK